MFGVDFSELMVILVIALIVIGPERLPKVARTLGHLWGRAQRYINSVKADISRDMAMAEFRQLQQQVQAEADHVGQTLKQATDSLGQQAQHISKAVAQPVHVMGEETQRGLQIPPVQNKFPVD